MSNFLTNEGALLTHLTSSQMPEEEAFCVFVRLMQEYRLRELFKPSMAELGLCIYQFEYLLQVKRKTGESINRHDDCSVTLAHRGAAFIYISSTSLPFLTWLFWVYSSHLRLNIMLFCYLRSNFQSWTSISGPRVSTRPCTPRPGSSPFSSPSSLCQSPLESLIFSCMR